MSLTDHVRFLFECPLAWERMVGDDRARRCEPCATTVTDLSALSAAEADSFLRARSGRVCVRLERDRAGRAVHWPDLRAAALAAGLAAACTPGEEVAADERANLAAINAARLRLDAPAAPDPEALAPFLRSIGYIE